MANALGWHDFSEILGKLDKAEQGVQDLYRAINVLKTDKGAVWGDVDRKANLKEIVDIHPDHSITGLGTKFAKLITLKTWLEDNEYIPDYVPPE